MLPRLAMLAVLVMCLSACGGGGGSSGSSGGSVPPAPPGPVVVIRQYDGVVTSHGGLMASQGDVVVEYKPADDQLVFSTVVGAVTVGPSRRVTLGGIEYAINFAPVSNVMIMVGVVQNTNYATWSITLLSSNG